MTAVQVLDAVGGIGDRFIRDLRQEAPKSKTNETRYRWVAAAVLALCFVFAIGKYLLFRSGETSPLPFTIAVYASDLETGSSRNLTLDQNGKIPLDLFYTQDGAAFFAFSYKAQDPEAPIRIVEVGEGSVFPAAKSVDGLTLTPGNVYLYCCPDLTKEAPYMFSFHVPGENGNPWYEISVLITLEGEQYFAALGDMKEIEVPTVYPAGSETPQPKEIPNWLYEWVVSYQSVIDSLNEEIGYPVVSLPEDKLWDFYEAYRDKSTQEFEQEARKDLKDAGFLD